MTTREYTGYTIRKNDNAIPEQVYNGDIIHITEFTFMPIDEPQELNVKRMHTGAFELHRDHECLMGLRIDQIKYGHIIGNTYTHEVK